MINKKEGYVGVLKERIDQLRLGQEKLSKKYVLLRAENFALRRQLKKQLKKNAELNINK